MEFLKKNYEKVILSVVLLGLAVAAALLLTRVADEKRRLDDIQSLNLKTAPKELVPVETSTNQLLLVRLRRPEPVVLSGTNNLFNPVSWLRRQDGRLEKMETGEEVGPQALEIVETKPLYTRISYEGKADAGGISQYRFRIVREAAAKAADRRPVTSSFISVSSQNAGLLLREMRPPDDPTEFVLESIEDKTRIVVGPGRDYEKVDGYMVTLRYGPENRVYRDKRVGEKISIENENYTIAVITESSVTVEAPNRKRTTITTGSPSASGSP